MSEPYRAITQLDRLIHEPARLAIMAVLSACESADFTYLLNATGLTCGNLSSHLAKLEEAGYVAIEKRFVGKKPNTLCRLTPAGCKAFGDYWANWRRIVQRMPDDVVMPPPQPAGDQADHHAVSLNPWPSVRASLR